MQYDADRTVDSFVIRAATLLVYWAIVGVLALVGWIGEAPMILLALAPLALMAIEGVATYVANRLLR